MGPFDRSLMAFYSLLFTVLLALYAAVLLGWSGPVILLRDFFYPGQTELFWSILVLLFVAGIRLFWVSMSKPRGKHVLLADSSLGQVKVSLQAIESLVEKVVSQINGIREVQPRVISVPQGVGIKIRTSVTPDINVPEVSAEIQKLVKERVFEVTGITVDTVKISVENISVRKPRVE